MSLNQLKDQNKISYEYISQSPREDDKYGVIFNYKCDKVTFIISTYKNEDGTIAIDSVKTLCEDNESILSQLAVVADQVLPQIEEDIKDKLDSETEADFDGDLMGMLRNQDKAKLLFCGSNNYELRKITISWK